MKDQLTRLIINNEVRVMASDTTHLVEEAKADSQNLSRGDGGFGAHADGGSDDGKRAEASVPFSDHQHQWRRPGGHRIGDSQGGLPRSVAAWEIPR